MDKLAEGGTDSRLQNGETFALRWQIATGRVPAAATARISPLWT
jgi:hypothetical protein